jgi:hypothetical protein
MGEVHRVFIYLLETRITMSGNTLVQEERKIFMSGSLISERKRGLKFG